MSAKAWDEVGAEKIVSRFSCLGRDGVREVEQNREKPPAIS